MEKQSRYLLRLPQFLMSPVRRLAEKKQKSIKELIREAVEDKLKREGIRWEEK